MNTYMREYETTEAFITVLATEVRYTFIKQSYNNKQSLATAEHVKLTVGTDVLDSELTSLIEAELKVTDCYSLNDWKII